MKEKIPEYIKDLLIPELRQLKEAVGRVEQRQECFEKSLGSLYHEFEGKFEGLRSEFQGLRSEVDGLRSEFHGLSGKVDGLNAKDKALKCLLDELRNGKSKK